MAAGLDMSLALVWRRQSNCNWDEGQNVARLGLLGAIWVVALGAKCGKMLVRVAMVIGGSTDTI